VLVQGVNNYSINAKADENGKLKLYHSANGLELMLSDGEIKAMIDFRDEILDYNIKSMNEFAINFTDVFNEIHKSGFGLDGSTGLNFFDQIPAKTDGGIYKLRSSVYISNEDTSLNGISTTSEPENFEKRLQRSSTAGVSEAPNPFLDITRTFANAQFAVDPDLSSRIKITINGSSWTSDKLSAYGSVEEFIDKVNQNPNLAKYNVTLTYNENTDNFNFAVMDGNNDVTIEQIDSTGAATANGFWSSANISYTTPLSYNNVADRVAISSKTPNDQVTYKDSRLSINGYTIYYDGSADTINDIVTRINETKCGVIASLDSTGRFTLTADAKNDFKILSLEDNGNLLSSLGILSEGKGYFGGVTDERSIITSDIIREPIKDAAFMFNVSDVVKNDTNKLATIGGVDTNNDGIIDKSNGPGDNTNSLKLANLKYKAYMNSGTTTFNDYYTSLISKVAVETKTAATNSETKEALLLNLQNLQQSVSGVSLDEEFTNMIKFQQGYTACAKIINAMDEMIQTLMGLGR